LKDSNSQISCSSLMNNIPLSTDNQIIVHESSNMNYIPPPPPSYDEYSTTMNELLPEYTEYTEYTEINLKKFKKF